MCARPQGWSFAVIFALAIVCPTASPAAYVPAPIMEVGRAPLRDIAYSPDGATLATLTTHWVELLDADTYVPLARFGRGGDRIAFSPDGSEVVVWKSGASGSFYDVATGALSDESPETDHVYTISPDWRRVAYAEGDVVYVWDRDEQAITSTLNGDPEPFLRTAPTPSGGTAKASVQRVRQVAFHPDGARLLVTSYRTTVALWDTVSGEVLRHYEVGTWAWNMALHPSGAEFAVNTYVGDTLVWGIDGTEARLVDTLAPWTWFHAFVYDPNGMYLWRSDSTGAARRLSLDDYTETTALVLTGDDVVTPPVSALRVRPGHNEVAAIAEHRIAVGSADPLRFERLVDHAWRANGPVGVAFSPRRGKLTTFGRVARVWSVPDGRLLHTYEFPEFVRDAYSSADGETAAADVLDETRVFDPATGDILLTVPDVGGNRPRHALSASGKFLATRDDRRTLVWSVETGEQVAAVTTPRVYDYAKLAFTHDDLSIVYLATVGGDVLRVWDIHTDSLLTTVEGGGAFATTERGIIQAAFPRDGSTNGLLEVRQVGVERPLATIEPPPGGASRAALYGHLQVDPSGRYVTFLADDPETQGRALYVHSATTGALLSTYPGWPRMRFTADGDYVLDEGVSGGLAVYRTEEFLDIVPTDVAARGKRLGVWGDVKRTRLLPNYPNPFNPETWIPFDLAEAGSVEVAIYDDLGRVVRRLDLGQLAAGAYRTRERAAYWDGRNDAGESVASGAYFIELSAGSRRRTRRATLAK